MQIDPVLGDAAQAGVAVVVLLSALGKWRQPDAFRATLAAWQIVPTALVGIVALAVAWAETSGALALLAGETRVFGATVLIALFTLFAMGLVVNIVRGHTDIDCGCGGLASSADAPRGIGWWHVGRAALFAALTCTAYATPVARAIVWFDYVTLAGSVLLIVCALLTLDALIANGPKLQHLRNS